MQTCEYRIFHETRAHLLAPRIISVDTQSDPLKTLKVLVEGLAGDQQTGIWLTPLKAMPAVPRLSPYDLAYLDSDGRIVSSRELAPTDPFPRHQNDAASALILPWHTLSASQIQPGDRVVLQPVDQAARRAAPPVQRVVQAPAPLLRPAAQTRVPFSSNLNAVPAAGHSSGFASLRTVRAAATSDAVSSTVNPATVPEPGVPVEQTPRAQPIQPPPATTRLQQQIAAPVRSAARTSRAPRWTFIGNTLAAWNRLWFSFRARNFRSARSIRRSPRIVEEC